MGRATRVPGLRRLLVLTAWTVLAAALADPLAAQDAFPHAAHEGLFPLCAGCHPAAAARAAPMYPEAALCGNCHDGGRLRSVRWAPPSRVTSTFRHREHLQATRAAGQVLGCAHCHRDPDGGRVSGRADGAAACAGCHVAHTADSECRLCHAPVRGQHDLSAHGACEGCHEGVRVDTLPRTRSFCLLCHGDLEAHEAPRTCTECHLLPAPRSGSIDIGGPAATYGSAGTPREGGTPAVRSPAPTGT